MRVPVYQRQELPTSPTGGVGIRLDDTGLGGGLRELGRALGSAENTFADIIAKRRQADRTITAITTQTAAMKELGDIETAYAESPDYAGAEDQYRKKAGEIVDGYGKRFDGERAVWRRCWCALRR